LVAPLVFDSVAEYPLTVGLACLLAPGARGGGRGQVVRDVALPVVTGGVTAGLIVGTEWAGPAAAPVGSLLALVVPAMLCFGFSRRPLRFGLGIGAILLAGTLSTGEQGRAVATRRSVFGVNRVTLDATRGLHLLIHGSTLRGAQSPDPARRHDPRAVLASRSYALPAHLRTREAPQMYLDRPAPVGVLAFHISNQHLDLEPVLADLARDAGLAALIRGDDVTPTERARGKLASRWAVMARRPDDLGSLVTDARWAPPRAPADRQSARLNSSHQST